MTIVPLYGAGECFDIFRAVVINLSAYAGVVFKTETSNGYYVFNGRGATAGLMGYKL